MDHLEAVNRWVENNADEILSTVSALIRIRTENIPPGGNEKPGQEYLRAYVSRFVAETDLDMFELDDVPGVREHPAFFPTIEGAQRVYAGRPILVARRRGVGGGRSLAFSGHMDTMPVAGQVWRVFPDPFSGRVMDGRLYGRGSLDMKSGTAAGFFVLKCLHDLRIALKGDVFAESVVDEEYGGVNGTLAARLRNPDIDFAILAEPSALSVGIETIGGSDWIAEAAVDGAGGIGLEVGRANPIYTLSRVALALQKYDRHLGTIAPPAAFDPAMRLRLLTYQLASGGPDYGNSGSVPTSGHLIFWQETFAGTGEAEARGELLDFVRRELSADALFDASPPRIETLIRFLEGHRTDLSHPALASIARSYGKLGLPHTQKGIPFSTDAFVFRKAAKTDVAIIGPVGERLHGADEYVDVQSILSLIRIMVLTAIDYCR
jgi:acetylornithine deacetylase